MKKMTFSGFARCAPVLIGAAFSANVASAQAVSNDLDALIESREIPVLIRNFARAATDIELAKYVALAGGVNSIFHFRDAGDVDNQPTIRMNFDTLYSTAVVDISQGATLTLPDVGDRYLSAMIVNQDHYINEVFHGGGTYTLDIETFDTPYVIIAMRTLVDAYDPDDVAAVHAIQDQMVIEAASSKPFILPDYDEEGYEALVAGLNALLPFLPDSSGGLGSKDEVDPISHLLGTAIGWGGLPETEAYYDGGNPELPVGEYKFEVPADVPVSAFWSISLYNKNGFFEKNDRNAYNVNSVMGARNDDNSMTVHLGGCEDDRVNCLPLTEGWSYVVRMYQPGPEVLDGSWTFPKLEQVD